MIVNMAYWGISLAINFTNCLIKE
uniref:Uncharacterized protein n=1 Tax=Anguilla anguilla TaxID=7936 RepID=A0A0E9Q9U1_ANGAN